MNPKIEITLIGDLTHHKLARKNMIVTVEDLRKYPHYYLPKLGTVCNAMAVYGYILKPL